MARVFFTSLSIFLVIALLCASDARIFSPQYAKAGQQPWAAWQHAPSETRLDLGLVGLAVRNCSLVAFGAVGDGVTDDTAAVQRAFSACVGHGVVVIDEGSFLVTQTIVINSTVDIRGAGQRSILLWAALADLLSFTTPVDSALISDFTVGSIGPAKTPDLAALRFVEVTKTVFDSLLFVGQGAVHTPGGDVAASSLGSVLDLGHLTDTVDVRSCVLWFLVGTGIALGRGSQVPGILLLPSLCLLRSASVSLLAAYSAVHVS